MCSLAPTLCPKYTDLVDLSEKVASFFEPSVNCIIASVKGMVDSSQKSIKVCGGVRVCRDVGF